MATQTHLAARRLSWVLASALSAGFVSAGQPAPPKAPPASRPAATQPATWIHPRCAARRADRLRMVESQIVARGVSDPVVLEAMRHVPRHWFAPPAMKALAYEDRPLPIGYVQTISQPYIVAVMTEALRLTPQSKVLEIGTGSGYQAAVLSEITPHVYTIEIVKPLAERTRRTFAQHGYRTIHTRLGDGYAGWPEAQPFDAIIVTCAPNQVPPKLLAQLKPGGRMCIPVGPAGAVQHLRRLTKQADGSIMTEDLFPVVFVPMTGRPPSGP